MRGWHVALVESAKSDKRDYLGMAYALTVLNVRASVIVDGRKDRLISFEMRGNRFRGDISAGDWIEVDPKDVAKGHVKRAINLSTSSEVTAKSSPFGGAG